MFKPVLLWTDCFVLIVIFSVFWLLYAIKTNKIIANWQNLYKTPGRVLALIILAWFALIAIVDSMHYRVALPNAVDDTIDYAAEVDSALDYWLKPAKKNSEKTYSRPFAKTTFVAELKRKNIQFVEENVNSVPNDEKHIFKQDAHDREQIVEYVWIKDRLQHGGAHLVDDASILADVVAKSKPAILQAWLVWLLLLGPWLVLNSRWINGRWCIIPKGKRYISAWIAILSLLMLTNVCWQLLPYYHILGTDKVGNDIFYAAIKSIRTGLIIGTLTTVVTLPFAVIMGTIAGYFRGWWDDVIQYIYTTVSSVPAVLLIAAGVLSLDVAIAKYQSYFTTVEQRADLRLLMLCVILGLTSWTSLCRLLRGETLKLRGLDYVAAARAIGASGGRIIWRHILPNLLHIVLISVVMDFSGLVLAEAVLSYVGVGVDPTMYSWGNMINSARMEMAREPIVWWPLLGAFSLMFILVLSANIVADALRDALDPKADV